MEERQDHATRTISIVMIIALVGKVLGLYRDHLLAVYYGTGMAANAFNTASRIPRVFFDAVFASAISACFIPVFSEYLTRKGREPAFRFAGCFITVMGLLSAVLSVLGILFAGPLVSLFADGYDAQTAELAVSLTRVMFPTVLFTGVAFSFVGVLQSLGEFNVPALISVVSNLVIILYYLTLDQQFGIYGLAVAFLVGWFLQAAVQVPSLRRLGFRYRPGLELRSEGMRKVFALMLPVMVSTWVQPINLTINSKFGSRLYEGAGVSAIEFSTNLYLVIAGVFVLSVTNVIFPKLSRLTGREQEGEFRETLRTTLHGCLFFVLPMSAGLMVLSWVSLGMTGYAVQNILSRAYFARQKGKVPLAAGAASILVNVLLCMALAQKMGVAGLALSSAVSSTVYALLLDIPLELRGEGVLSRSFLLDLGKMALATALMAVGAWAVAGLTEGLLPGKAGELLTLGASAAAGVAVYFPAAVLLRLDEGQLALKMVKRVWKRG